MTIEGIKRLDAQRIEIPRGFREGMRERCIIYVDADLEKDLDIKSLIQLSNVAALPGIVGPAMAMPDIHTGYGFPIGGVAAFDLEHGIVSPGGVGYDINCGVRLLRSNLTAYDIKPHLKELVAALYSDVPSGVGSKGRLKLSQTDERKIMTHGASWAVGMGMGDADDLAKTESGGCIEGADPDAVSAKALERGRVQQGTLGSGNHFLEIQEVVEIYDNKTADSLGLSEGLITVMIHTGSRGFGHQVCTDFIEVMHRAAIKYGIVLSDRELACAPCTSPEAVRYLSAMRAAANYAWANRQCIMHWTKQAFERVIGASASKMGMSLIYDVAHNIAKIETHTVDGSRKNLMVHRKGATRAFPPGHPELPDIYKQTGQPVLIPGDMGRASYVLLGTEKAMQDTWGSTCHGAGRLLSRHQALRLAKGRAIWRELEDKGIIVMSKGRGTLAEEMSEAYKDVSRVVDVVDRAGISKKVAKLKPMGVVKG